ncbi:aldo/keto reductase [Pullulanibacillus sp. KACC 23026]|uniref:aldo/keto reductase n=1 Tax=Pullulanibacillus sp. KACC 23026 TaxID=3028315 RepID=UPI0023B0042E|nr:aldo/keto reductase [Pullulanibacillus sp. KACC 23026]WEG14476.1 aldo/keto reductase [Pullulanibacillus sp. KACC 23026]
MSNQSLSAAKAGSFIIGGDLPIHRLGFGVMRLVGPGVWGEPCDREEAIRVLRRSIELGVNFIDTADAYGPFVADLLIRHALYPYASDLIIASKVGLTRTGPNQMQVLGRPEYLRQQTELNLRNLGLEQIDLLQLHRIDPKVPLAEQIGELALLKEEGKIRHIGLCEVNVEQLKAANAIAPIVSVQNRFNLFDRNAEPLLEYAEANGIAFIPWHPLATGVLARDGGPLDDLSAKLSTKPSQLALAWLLKRSKVILPIPGTSSIDHLEENIAATNVELSDEDFLLLSNAI